MATIVGTRGSDSLSGGKHNDVLIGDLETFTAASEPDPTTGSDTLMGGKGDDIIIGDVRHIEGYIDDFADLATPLIPDLGAGNALLSGGAGNDRIFSVETFDVTFSEIILDTGGNAADLLLPSDPSLTPPINYLDGGKGDDLLVAFILDPTFYIDNGGALNNFVFDHPASHIEGGKGDDIMVGQCAHYELYVLNGSTVEGFGAGWQSNVLNAGKGDDTVYGNSLEVILGVQNNSTISGFLNVFRGDHIDAGKGNDTVYGDSGALIMNIDATSSFDGEFHMGADVIDGGKGDDTLYGDIGHVELTGLTMKALNDMIVTSTEGDTIDGGNGDDWIMGQWDDDVLSGGNGGDVFAYSDLIDNGDDTILDFSTKQDVLEVNDANMLSDGGINADGDLVIHVADAGVASSITLVGVDNYAAVEVVVV